MKLNKGDYITLKSLKDVKQLYDDCEFIPNSCGKSLIADNTYFSPYMLAALGTSEVYKVERVDGDDFVIIIDGDGYWFDKKCVKDVYRLTKVK